jgi:hypothetical protein
MQWSVRLKRGQQISNYSIEVITEAVDDFFLSAVSAQTMSAIPRKAPTGAATK